MSERVPAERRAQAATPKGGTMSTTASALRHFPRDDEPDTELQFQALHDATYGVSIAVSATVQGVLIVVEPPLAVTADTAREVAEVITAAAKFVDSERERLAQ